MRTIHSPCMRYIGTCLVFNILCGNLLPSMSLTITIGGWSVLDGTDRSGEPDYLTPVFGSGESDWDINGDEFFAEKLLGSPAFYSLSVNPDRKDSTKPLIYVSVLCINILGVCLCITNVTHFRSGVQSIHVLRDVTMLSACCSVGCQCSRLGCILTGLANHWGQFVTDRGHNLAPP